MHLHWREIMHTQPNLALWGGHECTVNRIGDRFYDQTVLSGHHARLDDLDRFAELGFSSLRYPVLWERVCPAIAGQFDWAWSDERLERLRILGINPIVGLMHHGSGPAHTSFLDAEFPAAFAAYAGQVAHRYPWVVDWTPINEPLTTARFACLYGLWHPHTRDEVTFWACLFNQIEATREIRLVNPDARLIQTEDLGKTYATPELSHQASFDNSRRWMTWDLLEGRVTPDHALWTRLCALGFETRLRAIADDPCPADVIGVNHYVASDRFLDHRIDRYPPEVLGGNDFMTFADVAATRVLTPAPDGLDGAVNEAWGRYGRTLALTELHVGCTREEQVRWLYDGWDTALRARSRGVDVEAVTVWSLLGAFDWNSLLTRFDGSYESGAFDILGPQPRRTALGRGIAELDSTDRPRFLAGEGWWKRDVRLQYAPTHRESCDGAPRTGYQGSDGRQRPVLIVGDGALANALARACEWRAIAYERAEAGLSDAGAMALMLDRLRPWSVVNASRYHDVDAAETDARRCFKVNVRGASDLAEAAADRGIAVLNFSSDLVFDGAAGRSYSEADKPHPLSVFGLSMAAGERAVLEVDPTALIVRLGPTFSPHENDNFAARTLRDLFAGREVVAHEDQIVSPTYLPDVADKALDLLFDGAGGIWHLANEGSVSWAEFAARLAQGIAPADLVVGSLLPRSALGGRRPRNLGLTTLRGQLMPTFGSAVARYLALAPALEPPRDRPLVTPTGGGRQAVSHAS